MSKAKERGIDISFWQGKIDFAKVKENEIQFAILREGYRQTIDKRFMEYVFGCKTWGIRIDGVYHFIYLPNDRVTSNSETGILNAQTCLQNVQNAQLGKDEIIIWCDLEYDTITHAYERHGVTLSNQDIREITVSFCNEIKKAGYRVGLYTNLDYAKNKYGMDFVKKYDIWLADYTGNADIECLYQQYTSEGEVSGINGDVDMNFFFGEKEENNMSKAEKAINQMEEWARDDSYGYDQIYRWGEKNDYDCSAAVIQAWENAGVPVKSNGATYTGNMLDVFKKCGFTDVTSQINLANGSGLIRADVLLNTVHHTAMYCGNGLEVEASINEKGTTKGGKPGDQTGREFLIRSYRNYPWTHVLRFAGNEEVVTPPSTGTGSDLSKKVLWEGVVNTSELNVRTWAGTENPQLKSYPTLSQGTKVGVCETVKDKSGATWYYVKITGKKGEKYGFVSAAYIAKQPTSKPDDATMKDDGVITKSPQWVGKVTADVLNVRTWAGTNNPIIKSWPRLGYGNLVDVCDVVNATDGSRWYYVRIDGRIYGFVHSAYIARS